MSREVRRVPVDWQHPTEPNPYWLVQAAQRLVHERNLSLLRMPQVRFVGLCAGYQERHAEWKTEVEDLAARRGHTWTFGLEYHLTGYQGREDAEPTVHPFYVWPEGAADSVPVTVRDEDHLHELLTADKLSEEPDPAKYLPAFDVAEDELGWCLYETVTEGTPVTPVFATAEELIEHLVTVGQDYEQVPMRRAAAEELVRLGGSLGSMVSVGGQLYQSDTDADRIHDALGGGS